MNWCASKRTTLLSGTGIKYRVAIIPPVQRIFAKMSKHPILLEHIRILLEKPLIMHRHLFYSSAIFKRYCTITEDNCVTHTIVSTQYINDYINHEYSTCKRTFSYMSLSIFLVHQSNPILMEYKWIKVTIAMTITKMNQNYIHGEIKRKSNPGIFCHPYFKQCIIFCIM